MEMVALFDLDVLPNHLPFGDHPTSMWFGVKEVIITAPQVKGRHPELLRFLGLRDGSSDT